MHEGFHMNTAREIYNDRIRELPSSERLKLAALILEDLTVSAAPILDYSDSWSSEDLRDILVFSQSTIPDDQESDGLVDRG